MLAYPTPTFDAKTILQAPGYRPAGRGSELVYEKQPEAVTPLNLVNRNTRNGGFVGNIGKKFIQDPWCNPHFDPTKGTPLSKPGSVGNVGDQAIAMGRPHMAEPINAELNAIMSILNGKTTVTEHKDKLSAKQLQSLEARKEKLAAKDGAFSAVKDFTDTKEALKYQQRIENAVKQGFTIEEAKTAYKKLRATEAETAMFLEQDPSTRLYDLIDSKVSGTQNGSIRGNDETGLYLAKGGNAVLVKKAQKLNSVMDNETDPKSVRGPGRPPKPPAEVKMKKLSEFSGFGGL